ncbi:MAG: hypothetical protein JW837_17060 [Sedimentisphaerales bacterium]|nr:hypothetical protein [Sedimentisphaerales bacterium]
MSKKLLYLFSFVFVLIFIGNVWAQSGTGLRAEYFHWSGSSPPSREAAFRDIIVTRIDPQIYVYWNPGFVASHPDGLTPDFEIQPPPGVRADTFSVRWTGEIEALRTEAYTFTTGCDDGVRLYLNGELIIEAWADQDRVETSSDPIPLVAGQRYQIVCEGYENGGEAEWQLYWQSPSTPREVVPQRVLYPLVKMQDFPASKPVPADGAVIRETWANLSWTAGESAVSHDMYFSDVLKDVVDGTPDASQGNQGTTNFIVGFPGFPYPDGLVPGTTYYWRIDEVDETDPNSPWKGPVWSFTVAPMTAFNPEPADGAEAVELDEQLRWESGFEAKLHYVYFGDDYDEVNNATGALPTGTKTFKPGAIEPAKVYYWRVDEFDAITTYKGDVWSFTTVGAVGSPNPTYDAKDVKHNQILRWVAGDQAASHQVYFGTNKDAVRNADTGSPEYKGTRNLGDESYDPGLMEWDTAYYWRIDEVNNTNPDSPWTGNVWLFRTANFFVVDDFESYNDLDPTDPQSNRIFNAWIDGFEDPANGSLVGYDNPPFAEQSVVHTGKQSMPYFYDIDQKHAEATLTLTYPKDWTERGVDTLAIWFKGDWVNVGTPMYVALSGNAIEYHDNPEVTKIDVWTEWKIPLQVFADQGVNLANVDTITIGFGDKINLQAGGSGTVFIDDIRLYLP